MKNEIVKLSDGKTICRILDTIINKGDTEYIVIIFDTKDITIIKPSRIYDIMKYDNDHNLISKKEDIINSD